MLLLVLGLGLGAGACGESEPPQLPDPIVSRWEPTPVVVVVVVDTLARHTLEGWQGDFATSPNLQAFFSDATLLADTMAVRGLTSPAIASILTGSYPRNHGIRRNTGWDPPRLPTLIEKFHDAGYYTMGYAANTCQFIDSGVDDRYCTWSEEMPAIATHTERDRMLLDELLVRIDDRPAEQPLFVWMHLMNPHKPYTLIEPWYSEFHPQPYEGDLDAENSHDLEQVMLGELPFDDEDLQYVQAVYMSQVKETDSLFGEFVVELQQRDLWDEAVVLFGVDHGESLGARGDGYIHHGCSPYNDVMALPFAIRAPGRLPQGLALDGWVSQVDIGPTLADTAGIGWSGDRDGDSLVDDILEGELTPRTVYFERKETAAGIVRDGFKYFRDTNMGNTSCLPYSVFHPYPGAPVALHDLDADPEETDNLIDAEPQLAQDLHDELCAWVLQSPWLISEDATNTLVDHCSGAE